MTAPQWIKSSHSYENGSCVEVACWIKSSYSVDNGNCVEVAASPAVTGVRDSKKPEGPLLTFTTDGWSAFLRSVAKRDSGPAQ